MSLKNMNPKQYKLIKDFLTYIEKEDSGSGYILVDKGNWDNNSMFYKQVPPKGEKTRVRIHFEINRPNDDDIDVEIERFLRSNES